MLTFCLVIAEREAGVGDNLTAISWEISSRVLLFGRGLVDKATFITEDITRSAESSVGAKF